MSKNIIFIFELVSGGGFNKSDLPNSLFCEGFGMLKSIISDFKALDFEISTLLDYRVFFLSRFLHADIVQKVKKDDNYLILFKKFVEQCNYIFIIAPESSNILYELTKIVKSLNKKLLSTNLKCINQCSSKIKTYAFFKKNEIFTPKTYRIPFKRKSLDLDFIIQKYRKLNSSIVIKPEDGVGAESIYYFEREDQILRFYRELNKQMEMKRNYIVQEFIEGRDLSLSLIGSPSQINSQFTNPIILSMNSQNINIKNQNINSEYYGGSTPVENYEEMYKYFTGILKKSDFAEFTGYYGIDLIKKKDSSYCFIEINPRLTTSYLGIRNVINYNCAELIFNAKMNSLKNYDIKYLKFSLYSRIELIYNESIPLKELNEEILPDLIKEIPEFVTPPISLDNSNRFSCFIATKTRDLLSSKKRLFDIFQLLKNNNFEILNQDKQY